MSSSKIGYCLDMKPEGFFHRNRFSERVATFLYKHYQSLRTNVQYHFNRLLNESDSYFLSSESNSALDHVQVAYINLEKRSDRREKVEKEFKRVKFHNVLRIPAHQMNPPGQGCTYSHKLAIEVRFAPSFKLLMICEDDARFMKTSMEISEILNEFIYSNEADVLCLGFYLTESEIPFSNVFQRLHNSQSAVCYILKPHMVKKFIDICDLSLARYLKNPDDPNAAIDQVWKLLQKDYVFVAPYSPYVTQRPSYSDIAGGYARYPSQSRRVKK